MIAADRIVRNDEVVGSIPTSSTNLSNYLPTFADAFDHRETRFIGPWIFYGPLGKHRWRL